MNTFGSSNTLKTDRKSEIVSGTNVTNPPHGIKIMSKERIAFVAVVVVVVVSL